MNSNITEAEKERTAIVDRIWLLRCEFGARLDEEHRRLNEVDREIARYKAADTKVVTKRCVASTNGKQCMARIPFAQSCKFCDKHGAMVKKRMRASEKKITLAVNRRGAVV